MSNEQVVRTHDKLEIEIPGKGVAKFSKESRSTLWNITGCSGEPGLHDVLTAMHEGKAMAVRAFVEETVVRRKETT